jgi:hypothetical protein
MRSIGREILSNGASSFFSWNFFVQQDREACFLGMDIGGVQKPLLPAAAVRKGARTPGVG